MTKNNNEEKYENLKRLHKGFSDKLSIEEITEKYKKFLSDNFDEENKFEAHYTMQDDYKIFAHIIDAIVKDPQADVTELQKNCVRAVIDIFIENDYGLNSTDTLNLLEVAIAIDDMELAYSIFQGIKLKDLHTRHSSGMPITDEYINGIINQMLVTKHGYKFFEKLIQPEDGMTNQLAVIRLIKEPYNILKIVQNKNIKFIEKILELCGPEEIKAALKYKVDSHETISLSDVIQSDEKIKQLFEKKYSNIFAPPTVSQRTNISLVPTQIVHFTPLKEQNTEVSIEMPISKNPSSESNAGNEKDKLIGFLEETFNILRTSATELFAKKNPGDNMKEKLPSTTSDISPENVPLSEIIVERPLLDLFKIALNNKNQEDIKNLLANEKFVIERNQVKSIMTMTMQTQNQEIIDLVFASEKLTKHTREALNVITQVLLRSEDSDQIAEELKTIFNQESNLGGISAFIQNIFEGHNDFIFKEICDSKKFPLIFGAVDNALINQKIFYDQYSGKQVNFLIFMIGQAKYHIVFGDDYRDQWMSQALETIKILLDKNPNMLNQQIEELENETALIYVLKDYHEINERYIDNPSMSQMIAGLFGLDKINSDWKNRIQGNAEKIFELLLSYYPNLSLKDTDGKEVSDYLNENMSKVYYAHLMMLERKHEQEKFEQYKSLLENNPLNISEIIDFALKHKNSEWIKEILDKCKKNGPQIIEIFNEKYNYIVNNLFISNQLFEAFCSHPNTDKNAFLYNILIRKKHSGRDRIKCMRNDIEMFFNYNPDFGVKNFKLTDETIFSPLLYLIEEYKITLDVKFYELDVNMSEERFQTLIEIMTILLDHGAHVNEQAISSGKTALMQVLINYKESRKESMNIIDDNIHQVQNTLQSYNLKLIQLILKYEPNLALPDKDGKTVFDYAENVMDSKVKKIFEDKKKNYPALFPGYQQKNEKTSQTKTNDAVNGNIPVNMNSATNAKIPMSNLGFSKEKGKARKDTKIRMSNLGRYVFAGIFGIAGIGFTVAAVNKNIGNYLRNLLPAAVQNMFKPFMIGGAAVSFIGAVVLVAYNNRASMKTEKLDIQINNGKSY